MRELQTVIEGLAEQLHRAVAIDDPAIRLLAHTAHDEQVDEHRVHSIMTLRAGQEIADYVFSLGLRTAVAPIRVPGRADLRMLGRLCVPIRCQGLLLGYLWLIDDDESLTAEEIDASIEAAAAAGEILYQSRLLDDFGRAREQQVVLDLVGEDPADRTVAQAELDAVGLTGPLACRVLVVSSPFTEVDVDTEADELSLENTVRRAARRLKQVRALVAVRPPGRAYVLVAFRPHDDPLPRLVELGEEIHRQLSENQPETGAGAGVVVGIGPVATHVREAKRSFEKALGVVTVCRRIESYGPVASWERLGIYGLLHQLPVEDIAEIGIPAGLQALVEVDADQWLVQTLETYLAAAGNVQESARRLHIHRATLYYRLSRIEEITGMSLADGEHRLALHLGLKLAHLTGQAAWREAEHPAPDEGAESVTP